MSYKPPPRTIVPTPDQEDDDETGFITSEPIISSNFLSPSRSRADVYSRSPFAAGQSTRMPSGKHNSGAVARDGAETDPLLKGKVKGKKPFYRARPLWIVPFVFTASIIRGMTLAPRIEVYTQLSCNTLHGRPIDYNHTRSFQFDIYSLESMSTPRFDYLDNSLPINLSRITLANEGNGEDDDGSEDPTRLPSQKCISDPNVQAGAAKLQMIMTTTMGVLSAITTGWWGQFGERHGRTRVLAASTFGLLLTDMMFILVSMPNSPLSGHGHKLLVIAPFFEGLLGGWSTLQAATTAYVSDCTSHGSRAHIFSRFTGIFFIGSSVGPVIGALLIAHSRSFPSVQSPSVTPVFWVAVLLSFTNFLLAVFVFPESLSKEKLAMRVQMDETARLEGKVSRTGIYGFVIGLFVPLKVFAPRPVKISAGYIKKDWSLTFLALAVFVYWLSLGIWQLKYLYAEHVFGWGAETLSYYISAAAGVRALHLLIVLPYLIATFKPKPQPRSPSAGGTASTHDGKKPKPTPAHLAAEMSFDFFISKAALVLDILSHTLVAFSSTAQTGSAQAFWVGSTLLSSFGSGVVPSIQSLALCLMHAHQERSSAEGTSAVDEGGAGALFGALAVLQSIGNMILGPMLFGLVFSWTVGPFPKTIFAMAAGILFVSLALISLVQPSNSLGPRPRKGKGRAQADVERGRSRASKDLSGPSYHIGSRRHSAAQSSSSGTPNA